MSICRRIRSSIAAAVLEASRLVGCQQRTAEASARRSLSDWSARLCVRLIVCLSFCLPVSVRVVLSLGVCLCICLLSNATQYRMMGFTLADDRVFMRLRTKLSTSRIRRDLCRSSAGFGWQQLWPPGLRGRFHCPATAKTASFYHRHRRHHLLLPVLVPCLWRLLPPGWALIANLKRKAVFVFVASFILPAHSLALSITFIRGSRCRLLIEFAPPRCQVHNGDGFSSSS